MDFLKQLLETGQFSNTSYESEFAKRRHLFLIQKARCAEFNRLLHSMNNKVSKINQVTNVWINRFSSYEIQADDIRSYEIIPGWFERFPDAASNLPKAKILFNRMINAKHKFEDAGGRPYGRMISQIKTGRRK